MILCCGEALIDMIQTADSAPAGGYIPIPGGSCYNTAIAIGRLGVPVQFLGRLSTDFFGSMQIQRLCDNHVGVDLIIRSGQNTSLAFVQVEEGREPCYAFYIDGTADRSLAKGDLPAELPAHTSCIVFGSIAMTMEPIAAAIETFILNIVTTIDNEYPVIAFDPNIRPFLIKDREAYMERFEKWAAAATICKASDADLAFIYPRMEPEQALGKLLALGPALVICTLGDKGALALLRTTDGSVTRVSVPGIAVRVADTVGAGDTFHGAFLSWLELRGKMTRSAIAALNETDLRDALLFANRAASIVCSRRGAEPPTLENMELALEICKNSHDSAEMIRSEGLGERRSYN